MDVCIRVAVEGRATSSQPVVGTGPTERLIVRLDDASPLHVDVGEGTAERDVVVRADPGAGVATLLGEVQVQLGLPIDPLLDGYIERTGRRLEPHACIADLALRNGDRLVLGRAAPGTGARLDVTAPPHVVMIVGGRDAGRRQPLPFGEHIVGRDPAAAVVLEDERVSRRHAALILRPDGMAVHDLGSKNGTRLDGRRVTEGQAFEPGQVIEIGSSLLVVERPDEGDGSMVRYTDGRLAFNRPPRVSRPLPQPTFQVPAPPERPPRNRLPLAACIVPLMMGAVMFAVMPNNPLYVVFLGMSPLMAIVSFVDGRRTGRSDFKKRVAAFEVDLASLAERLEDAHREVLVARRAAQPSSTHLLDRALRAAPTLWERRPHDDDFLIVRIGTATLPSHLLIEPVTGGDDELRARTDALRGRHTVDQDVPVLLAIAECSVSGIAGTEDICRALARSVVVQIAALHSPRDVALVALVTDADTKGWSWLKWLPHTETLARDAFGSRTVASDRDETRVLFESVVSLMQQRVEERDRASRTSTARSLPAVVVIFDGEIGVARSSMSRLLEDGPDVGIYVLCVGESREALPGECRAVVACDGPDDITLTYARTGAVTAGIAVDVMNVDAAKVAALALAPLHDVTVRPAGGELPSSTNLVELLGIDSLTGDAIAQRWEHANGLHAIIGVGESGPFGPDLRRDGPHALVAGTTGSGKSELLQTLVAALAVTHPPTRLTFVLVDYKGGAAFKDCVDLPHTVGFFTDLDPHLARRALESLNAELRTREHLLQEAGAKDLVEMQSRAPAAAPPSLLIIFDEFAFLKKEVPEFVAGVVDIAQRGRSLGVHLVLATQRPTGVVDDHIRANTNLRIALRVSDEAESRDVIDSADAARIPRSRPGRAFVSTGHGEIREVQTAYVGGQTGVATSDEVRVQRFRFGLGMPETPVSTRAPAPRGPTDLQRIVAAVGDAAQAMSIPAPRRPWLDPLPDEVFLDDVDPAPTRDAGLASVVGLVDEPARQCQRPWTLDLAANGHVLVYGVAGSGKTTLLRTLAAGLALRCSTEDLHVYGLDFATRALRAVEALPHCGGVVAGDEIERVERLFAMLDALIDARKELLGRHGLSSIEELRASNTHDEPLPRVVVLLDGYPGFHATFEQIDHGEVIDRLARQAADGRAVGLHFVITTDRRAGIPNALMSVIPERVVLRMANDDEYSWLGLGPEVKDATLPPGRGFVDRSTEMQVALVGRSSATDAQADALARIGRGLVADGVSSRRGVPARVEPLPPSVAVADLPAPEAARLAVPVGLEGAGLRPVVVDLADGPLFLVAGPDHSGRSSTLRTITAPLIAAGTESYLLAPRRSPLLDVTGWTAAAQGLTACEEQIGKLTELIRARPGTHSSPPVLVVVDDGDELVEGKPATALDALVRAGRDAGLVLVVAAQTHVVHRTFGGWLTTVRKAKHGIVLSPDVDIDGEMFGVRLPRKTVRSFPPGRGYLVRRTGVSLVQVAQ